MNRVLSASVAALALLTGSLLHDAAQAQSRGYALDGYAAPNRTRSAQAAPLGLRSRMLTWSGKIDRVAPILSAPTARQADLRGPMIATPAADRYGARPVEPALYQDARSALPRTDVKRFQAVNYDTRRMEGPHFMNDPSSSSPPQRSGGAGPPKVVGGAARPSRAQVEPLTPAPDRLRFRGGSPLPASHVEGRSTPSASSQVGMAVAPSAVPVPTSIYDRPRSSPQPAAVTGGSSAPMKTAQMAPPVARTSSGGQGVRFYSVHRQYGLTPDAAPIPPQFFAETPDLSTSAGPDPLRRSVAGSSGLSARAARVAGSTAQPDPALAQP